MGSVTFGGGVGTDQGGQVLEFVEVGFVVAGGLARTIGVLVTEGETQSATSRDYCGSSGQDDGQKTRHTHDEDAEVELRERHDPEKSGKECKVANEKMTAVEGVTRN